MNKQMRIRPLNGRSQTGRHRWGKPQENKSVEISAPKDDGLADTVVLYLNHASEQHAYIHMYKLMYEVWFLSSQALPSVLGCECFFPLFLGGAQRIWHLSFKAPVLASIAMIHTHTMLQKG